MSKIVDLTMPMSNASDGLEIKLQINLPVYMDQQCYAYDLNFKSHHGTYFESPSHVFRNTKNTCDYKLDELILTGVCLHLKANKNRCINAKELDHATKDIDIQPDSALLIDTADTAEGFR